MSWISIVLFFLICAAPLRAQTVTDTGLVVTQIASGLSAPTNMAFIGANDILILQKNDGRVRRVLNGVLQGGEVLDLERRHGFRARSFGHRASSKLRFELVCLSLLYAKQQRRRYQRCDRSTIAFFATPGAAAN